MFHETDVEVKRAISAALRNKDLQISNYPDKFGLIKIGMYENGVLVPMKEEFMGVLEEMVLPQEPIRLAREDIVAIADMQARIKGRS